MCVLSIVCILSPSRVSRLMMDRDAHGMEAWSTSQCWKYSVKRPWETSTLQRCHLNLNKNWEGQDWIGESLWISEVWGRWRAGDIRTKWLLSAGPILHTGGGKHLGLPKCLALEGALSWRHGMAGQVGVANAGLISWSSIILWYFMIIYTLNLLALLRSDQIYTVGWGSSCQVGGSSCQLEKSSFQIWIGTTGSRRVSRFFSCRGTKVTGSIEGIVSWSQAQVVDLSDTLVTGRLTKRWRGCCRHLRILKLSARASNVTQAYTGRVNSETEGEIGKRNDYQESYPLSPVCLTFLYIMIFNAPLISIDGIAIAATWSPQRSPG